MTEPTVPSANGANLGHMTGVFREVLNKFLQNMDDMLPAVVVNYDRDKQRVSVQPLIMVVKTNNAPVQRAAIEELPVFQIGAGGFVLNFNLRPGDLGFIKANDRDISLFLQSYTQSTPNTFRKHSFEDAIFIPAPLHGIQINDEDDENCVLQTLDGKQRIAIWGDRIKMTSSDGTHTSAITIHPDHVIIDTPLTTFTGDIETDGERGDGDATFNGTLRARVDVIATDDSISLVHHVHGGVQTGGGNTGEPV